MTDRSFSGGLDEGDTSGSRYDDPDVSAKRWQINQEVRGILEARGWDVPTSAVTAFVTSWISRYQNTHDGRMPGSLSDIAEYDSGVVDGLEFLPVSAAVSSTGSSLPPLFNFQDDSGNWQTVIYSFARGVRPFPANVTEPTGGGGIPEIPGYNVDYPGAARPDVPDIPGYNAPYPGEESIPRRDLPVISSSMFQNAVQAAYGSRGGGRAGRQARAYDRDQLIESATNLWRQVLLEPPSNIEAIVDRYISEANAFWVKEGGSKDFETFLWGEMRKTARHSQLYRWKPEEQHEQDFMNQYTGRVAAFGLRPDTYTQQLERSLMSGGSPAGQSERIGRSREVVEGSQGSFSKAFASTLAGLGPGGRRG